MTANTTANTTGGTTAGAMTTEAATTTSNRNTYPYPFTSEYMHWQASNNDALTADEKTACTGGYTAGNVFAR